MAARVWTALWRPCFEPSFFPEIAFFAPFLVLQFIRTSLQEATWFRIAAWPTHPDSPFFTPPFTRSLARQLLATEKNKQLALKTLRMDVSFPLLDLRAVFSFPQLTAL